MIKELTRFQALYVMYLRCRLGGTWRYVGGMFKQRYNLECDIWYVQSFGRQLCELAEDKLNVESNSITQVAVW
jgi:hypothetical protein